jgi:hypothetical protein
VSTKPGEPQGSLAALARSPLPFASQNPFPAPTLPYSYLGSHPRPSDSFGELVIEEPEPLSVKPA